MSRVLVRTALATWLQAAQIFDDVKAAKVQVQVPTIVAGTVNYRSAAYILLSEASEVRIAMGGAFDGYKEVNYIARVVMHFWSLDPDWVAAQDRFDDIIDAVKTQVRSGGRTLGNPNVVFQAGEWTYGINDRVEEPESTNGNMMHIVGEVSFEITELIES